MKTDDFDYHLPESCIAQYPVEPRDSCKLLVLHRTGSTAIEHARFSTLPLYLRQGDRLVFNDTKVLPARIFVRKPTGGRCEIFFLEKTGVEVWNALVKPGSNARKGGILHVEDDPSCMLKVIDVLPSGERLMTIAANSSYESIESVMERFGHIPLPHYIDRNDETIDRDAYQTVYASVPGAIAAPTAGLHFTPPLLDRLNGMGIGISFVTLHVGIGTFRPVKAVRPEEHEIHEERYAISEKTVGEILATKAAGGRVIAVGTTVVRVLEHCYATNGTVWPHQGSTRIMILPPYQFGMIDGLITNFHLPRSTLLMLVSAFGGRDAILNAYKEAIAHSYRFFSYGDAMFLV